MFKAIRHRMRSVRALPAKPQFDQLGARIDNVEEALHREVHALRREIDERAFSLVEMLMNSSETRLAAQIDSATRAAVVTSIAASREHTEAAVEAALDTSRGHLAQLRIDLVRVQRMLERIEREKPDATSTDEMRRDPNSSPSAREPVIDDLLYLAIEDRFRGNPAEIRNRQERYLPYLPAVVDDTHPLLDLGCGRGEWLQVLADAGIPARGLDANVGCVEECRVAGLTADVGDLVDTLAGSDDHSLGAISMFHVAEHLPFGVLADVLEQCARVLVPGGLLILETPNALNLRVAAINFWLDPTHVRPLHPELLHLLAERGGFSRTQDLFLNDIGVPLELPDQHDVVGAWVADLSRSLDGAGDYALLAWTSGEVIVATG